MIWTVTLWRKKARATAQRESESEKDYTAAEWDDWADKRSQELEDHKKAMTDLEAEVDWLGAKGKGRPGKGGGKGGKGNWGGKGKGGGTANTGGASRDMTQVICLWCEKKGHFRRDCPELAEYKKGKDAERAKKGDHSVYEPPQRSGARRPPRGAGSLEDDFVAIGLTGDDEGSTS